MDLFAYANEAPRQRHSETSCEAADSITPHLGRLQFRVLDFIRSTGNAGATDEEIQESLSMAPNTERPRRRELQIMDYIRDTGVRRKTRSGRRAVAWVAVIDNFPGDFTQFPESHTHK